MTQPTLQYLREALRYDPETGKLTWLARPRSHFETENAYLTWITKHAGDEAGTVNSHGYTCLKLGNKRYAAHRIAFALYHSIELVDLPAELDHVNCLRTDNRIVNIRPATHAENGRNRTMRSDNTTGYKGVSWNKRDQRFQARICVDQKLKHLGYFDTVEEAGAAYARAAKEHFGEFARIAA